jgi:ABC-type nitrate/sulfonate/bicarbonate transport system substrate-binding protein
VPDYYELVLVTNDTMVKQHGDVVKKFLAAAARGYKDAAADQEAAIDALVKASPDTDRAVETQGLKVLVPTWTDGVPAWGTQTADRWQKYADWMKNTNLLDKEPKVSDCWTGDFLPR